MPVGVSCRTVDILYFRQKGDPHSKANRPIYDVFSPRLRRILDLSSMNYRPTFYDFVYLSSRIFHTMFDGVSAYIRRCVDLCLTKFGCGEGSRTEGVPKSRTSTTNRPQTDHKSSTKPQIDHNCFCGLFCGSFFV